MTDSEGHAGGPRVHPFKQRLIDAGMLPEEPAPRSRSPLAVVASPDDPDARRYALAALRMECDRVAGAVPTTRNDTLNRASFSIGQLVGAGHLAEGDAVAALTDAGQACGLPDDEIDRTVLRSLRDGARNPRQVHLEPRTGGTGTVLYPPDPEPVEAFWSARPALRHVLEFARARRAGPWAVLGVVLARAVAATEPNIVLPPTIGSAKSTNLFVALVGPSGGGKGAAEGAATDAVEFIGSNSMPIAIEEFPLGSGEGIARTFQTGPIDEDARGRSRAMFSVPEVDTIAAIGARQGSTLMAELRKVYMGEQIGFANANKNTRTTLAAHSYRACMTIGVQPLKAGPLLDDADGGTPQRFLWLPVSDPDAPDERPAEPAPMRVKVRAWTARVELNVPEVARQEMDAHRLAVLRGDDVDPLDGHRMLTRLKVAAALSILDAREFVTEEDWQLAGTVIRVSDRTRAEVKRAAAERAREAARARAEARAEEAGVIADRADERIQQRARAAVLRYLDRHPTATRKDLRGNMRNDLRGELDATLDDLLAENVITSTGGVYALA